MAEPAAKTCTLLRVEDVIKDYGTRVVTRALHGVDLCVDRAEFAAHPESAAKLLTAGESPRDEALDVNELGAWTMVAHLLLNLSETVTKG